MTNAKTVTKEELANVIDSLANAFQAQAEEEHFEMCAKYLKEHGERLLNPEHYGLLVGFNLEQFNGVLIQNLLNTEQVAKNLTYTEKQKYDLEFLYEHYQFVDYHLDKIVEKYEGFACSADKTRYILQLYREYIVTEKMPVFEERNHYWIPNYGSAENWIKFVETLSSIYYGNVDKYMEARTKLIEELEKDISITKENQRQYLSQHPNLKSIQNTPGEDGTSYHFYEERESGDISMEIHIGDEKRNGYILKIGGKRIRHGISNPELKERGITLGWVEELMNHF